MVRTTRGSTSTRASTQSDDIGSQPVITAAEAASKAQKVVSRGIIRRVVGGSLEVSQCSPPAAPHVIGLHTCATTRDVERVRARLIFRLLFGWR